MAKWLGGLILGIGIMFVLFFVRDVQAGYQRMQQVDEIMLTSQVNRRIGHLVTVWDEEEKTNCYIFFARSGGNSMDCVRSKNF